MNLSTEKKIMDLQSRLVVAQGVIARVSLVPAVVKVFVVGVVLLLTASQSWKLVEYNLVSIVVPAYTIVANANATKVNVFLMLFLEILEIK